MRALPTTTSCGPFFARYKAFCPCFEVITKQFQYIEISLQPRTKYSIKPLKFIPFCSIMVKMLDGSKDELFFT